MLKKFINPSKKKAEIFVLLIALIYILAYTLFALREWDIAGIFLTPLMIWPIKIFDFITFSAFVPRDHSFLPFPSIPELGFMLVFDIVMIYLLSCIIYVVFLKNSKIPKY